MVALLVLLVGMLGFTAGAQGAEAQGITGVVTALGAGTAIAGIEVCVYETPDEGLFGECVTTDANGEYSLLDLTAGSYEVEFSSPAGSGLNYITQFYDHRSSESEADLVEVTAGAVRHEIDAQLEEGGRISGTVIDASTKTAVEGIEVCAYASGSESFGCASTDAGGQYTLAGLSAGAHEVEFSSPYGSGLNYVTQYYNGERTSSAADPVSVVLGGTTPNIDAELDLGGTIKGVVTDASSGAGLQPVLVCALVSSTEAARCEVTSSSGEYTLTALPAGEYKVGFVSPQHYAGQYYDHKATFSEAQPVAVTVGNVAAGIDAALIPTATSSPVNTRPPVISGSVAVGQTLSCANGLWSGSPTPTFSERWLRDGTPIAGAVGGSYTVQSVDQGHGIACEVTASNTVGQQSARATVSVPAAAVVTTTSTATTSTSAALAGPPSVPLTAAVVGSRVVVSKGATSVSVACSQASCKGSVELTITTVTKLRRGRVEVERKGTLILAKGSFATGTSGRALTVVLHLTAAGRKRLAHAKQHPVRLSLVLAVAGARTSTRTVTAT